MKILRNFMIYLWFNFYLICISLPKKIQIRRSRFDNESESEYYSSCKIHESESEYSGFGGKDSNPNLNIRYNTVLQFFQCLIRNSYFKCKEHFLENKCQIKQVTGKDRILYIFDPIYSIAYGKRKVDKVEDSKAAIIRTQL